MDISYQILRGEAAVGMAQLSREGLFYRIDCCCKAWTQDMTRIYMVSEQGREDLGICVYQGGALTLTKRLPIKRIGENPQFFAVIHPEKEHTAFFPLQYDKQFMHIDKLEYAKLCISEGNIGISLPISRLQVDVETNWTVI